MTDGCFQFCLVIKPERKRTYFGLRADWAHVQTELTWLARRHLKNSFGSTNGMKMLHNSNYGCIQISRSTVDVSQLTTRALCNRSGQSCTCTTLNCGRKTWLHRQKKTRRFSSALSAPSFLFLYPNLLTKTVKCFQDVSNSAARWSQDGYSMILTRSQWSHPMRCLVPWTGLAALYNQRNRCSSSWQKMTSRH